MMSKVDYLQDEVLDFFGKPHMEVGSLNLDMFFRHRDNPPEWLRGKPVYADLPRVIPPGDSAESSLKFTPALIPRHSLPERIEWIIENLRGPWTICEHGFGFMDQNEAILYRLRWCG